MDDREDRILRAIESLGMRIDGLSSQLRQLNLRVDHMTISETEQQLISALHRAYRNVSERVRLLEDERLQEKGFGPREP